MPLYSGRYAQILEEEQDPERFIRRFLAVLEADLRETALLGLAAWHQASLPKEQWQAALPNLFKAIAGLQKPAYGHWNGLLYSLRDALRLAQPAPGSPSDANAPWMLEAILAWLREPTEPLVAAALRGMSQPLGYSLPGDLSRWHAISLTVCLRNRIAHEHPVDAWWAAMAPGVIRLASSLAALPPCLDSGRLVYPSPWFLQREGVLYAFGGIQGDDVIYAAPGLAAVRLPATQTEIVRAFQHALGQAEIQQAAFREMLSKLAPEEIRGVLLGDFLLGPPVAQGGFAVVHKGYQLSTQRKAALKVFPDALTESKRALMRKEAAHLGAFNTPEIVRLIGLYENVPWVMPADISLSAEPWFRTYKKTSPFKTFLAMEWVDGEKLDDLYRRPAAAAPAIPVLVEWFATAAEALAKVHAHPGGLIHRDVTPNNLMVTVDGQLKLMDFGIARGGAERRDLVTRTQLGVGTPAYMAPEQLDEVWTDRSDVYALCATFYELFARKRLYDHDRSDMATVNKKKRDGDPPDSPRRGNPEVPWEIDTLLLGSLRKEPELRPASRELADDLRRVQANQPIHYKRPPFRRRTALWYRRNRTAVRAALAACVLLGGLSTVLGMLWLGEQRRSTQMTSQVGGLKQAVDVSERLAEERSKEAALRKGRELRTRYLIEVKDAYKAWEANHPDEARVLLDRLVPANTGGPDLREVEWYYLDYVLSATSRELNFGGQVHAVRFSPDGKRLAALGIADDDSYCVNLWESPGFRHERTLVLEPKATSGNISPVRSALVGPENLAFSQKGSLLAVTYGFRQKTRIDGIVKVWECDTGRQVFSASDAGIAGGAVLFSPDGRYLIAGGYNNAALVWDLPGGSLRWTLPGYDSSGVVGTPSAVAHKIARPVLNSAVGLEADVRLMPSVKDVSEIPRQGKDLLIVAEVDHVLHFRIFNRAGYLAGNNFESRLPYRARQIEDLRKQLVDLWPPHQLTESEKGRVITAVASILPDTHGLPAAVNHLLFSPGNRYLDRDSGTGCARTGWPPADPPAYDDGRRANGTVERDTILAYSPPQGSWGLSNDVRQDRLTLFHAAAWNGGRPAEDKTTASPVRDLRNDFSLGIGQDRIQTLAFGSDHVAIADAAGQVAAIQFDVNGGTILARCVPKGHKGEVRCLAFSPGAGQYLVAAGPRSLTIWSHIFALPGNRLFADALRLRNAANALDSRGGTNGRWEYRLLPAHPGRGRFQAIVEIDDRASRPGPPRKVVTPFTSAFAIALSLDGTRLAITNNERTTRAKAPPNPALDNIEGARREPPDGHNIWILDAMSGEPLHVLTVPHARVTLSLVFDRDGKTLLSSSTDNQIRLWDVDTGNLLRQMDSKGGFRERPELSPNGRWIAVGSVGGAISVWETATAKAVAHFEGEPERCIWAFHDNLLAVPERGRQIKVWDLEKGTFVQEMNDLGRKIQDLAFLADGKRLVSSSEGTMTLWTLETESEICSIPVPSYINGQWPKIVEVLEKLKRPPQQ